MIAAVILTTSLIYRVGGLTDFDSSFISVAGFALLRPTVPADELLSRVAEHGVEPREKIPYPILISDSSDHYRFSEDGGFSNRWSRIFKWPAKSVPLGNSENSYVVIGDRKLILVRRVGIDSASTSRVVESPKPVYQILVLDRDGKRVLDFGWRGGLLSQVSLSPNEKNFAAIESTTRKLFVGSTTSRGFQAPITLPKPGSLEFGGQDPYIDGDHPQSSQLAWLAGREIVLSSRDPDGLYRLSPDKAMRIGAKAWLGFFSNTEYGISTDYSGVGYLVKNFFKPQRICQIGPLTDSISTATSPSKKLFAFVNWDGQAADRYRRGYVLDGDGRKRAFDLLASKEYRFGPTFIGERYLAFSDGKSQADVYDLNFQSLDQKSIKLYQLNVKHSERVVIRL